MNPEEKFYRLLQKYVPEKAVKYCHDLWMQSPFHFTATKSRSSKYGDYTYVRSTKEHTITVNSDQNKYSFLMTYVHEVAHLRTNLKHGPYVKPHGEEWKREFKLLVSPLSALEIFPESVHRPLMAYMNDPKASSCTDLKLLKALSEYDPENNLVYLSDFPMGGTFKFHGKHFIKLEVKRTRALCREVSTGVQYYIPIAAQIELLGQARLAF